ncbi:Cupin-2 domain-containing protein [Mycena venus]|uniref:Cupin-2 domain-containing protein n=1 Tax=Mycena venus TaxID=2733690 RepID=A0A8H6X913_9AGAR|nr:Cupin-2 domain-containing protein [Mycena venus]
MSASSVLRAAAIQSLLKPRAHPLDASRVRTTASLGDQVGLTKVGIHKSTLPPNMVSTVEHFHDIDDEWMFILRGSGTLLCAGEGEDTVVGAGDFVGFAAGGKGARMRFARVRRGWSTSLEGAGTPSTIGKTLVVNRTPGANRTMVVDEENVKTV